MPAWKDGSEKGAVVQRNSEHYSRNQAGSGAFWTPRFYGSCADALTDGFSPQSGLVQGSYKESPPKAAIPHPLNLLNLGRKAAVHFPL